MPEDPLAILTTLEVVFLLIKTNQFAAMLIMVEASIADMPMTTRTPAALHCLTSALRDSLCPPNSGTWVLYSVRHLGLAFYRLPPAFFQSEHDSIPQPFSDLVCLMVTQPFIKEHMLERQTLCNFCNQAAPVRKDCRKEIH